MEKQYEVCFLLRSDIGEEETGKEVKFIEEKMKENGGEIVKKDFWGTKRLAYPIKKKTDASYYIFYLKASPKVMPIMERSFERRDNILRYLFMKRGKLPAEGKNEKAEPRRQKSTAKENKTR
jgi:small subunit ribosomal protein S6